MEAVVSELSEPLLVDPWAAVCPEKECVAVRKAVLGDLASAHEHHPRVADELRPREDDREQRDDGDRADDQPVRLQSEQGARAAIDWKGGGDRGFDTSAIGPG
jgi:hypothetical protein